MSALEAATPAGLLDGNHLLCGPQLTFAHRLIYQLRKLSWTKKLTWKIVWRVVAIGLSLFGVTLFEYEILGLIVDGSVNMETLGKVWDMVRAVA
ncbi:hypothetical protein G6L86_18695 [Agrobacterium tumefaciens]|uniref:hypothetical protein n=1 Tax=Agrobacterium tumefaciens TaxID=358 RepID=UPI001571C496|nr:hypothetical protein [Agrobacterium tumefaciens]NSX87636.1 hypothetical protein [Agrobacterium tumefaciens]